MKTVDRPKISVISPSLNTGGFLRETINSALNQSYKNCEFIVVDGGSTDETLDILRGYTDVRWISEKDSGVVEAVRKGLAMAGGEYILQCSVSDGYLDMDWFRKCVEVLDNDKEVSLVWGFQQEMSEDGKLGNVIYRQFHKSPPPQKTEYFYYWLATFDGWPEGNMCIRKEILDECYPPNQDERNMDTDAWLEFNYTFNSRGYLPYCLPVVASFGRSHGNQRGQIERKSKIHHVRLGNFIKKARSYRRDVLLGRKMHYYRDSAGNVLPYSFSKYKFFSDQVFSPKALSRSAINLAATLARPFLSRVLRSKNTPQFLVAFIRKLKLFYASKQ